MVPSEFLVPNGSKSVTSSSESGCFDGDGVFGGGVRLAYLLLARLAWLGLNFLEPIVQIEIDPHDSSLSASQSIGNRTRYSIAHNSGSILSCRI